MTERQNAAASEPQQPKNEQRLHHRRLREFEVFDRIEIAIVPRYKTSGMSGDEWRQHIAMRFYFKGELVHEAAARSMDEASMVLGGELLNTSSPIARRVIEMESEGYCDQPSCPDKAVGRFLIKEVYGPQGQKLHPDEALNRGYYRQFCKKHLRRGDCGLEDADNNYVPLDGVTSKDAGLVIESPSSFGGVVGGIVEKPT